MNYTNWLLALLQLICKDANLTIHEIALDEIETKSCCAMGLSPEDVYFTRWNKDAGHYYKIPF
jgi:hypothetical protein